MSKQELIEKVTELVEYPEVEGETYIADWINEGDTEGMTPEEIAAEWDNLSRQARAEKDLS